MSEIKSIFLPGEIAQFFDDFQSGKAIHPGEALNELNRELHSDSDSDEGPDESDVLRDAEKLLLAENARRLLLGE